MKNRKKKNLETKVTPENSYSELLNPVKPEEFYKELTDPRNHNPDNYCYIVHGINPCIKNQLLLAAIKNEGFDPSQCIDLLYYPKRISEKKLISTSIINQDLNIVWGKGVFFVLDVPWNNFVSMSPRDMGTNITRPDSVLESAKKPYITPSELIKQTKFLGRLLNEVVVTGNKDGNKVKIEGIGIKLTDCEDRIRAPEEADRMREIAQDMNVPVIEMTKISRIKDSEPEVHHGYISGGKPVRSIYVNKNKHRYCFEGNWDKTQLKDVFKGDKNFYGGYNPISKAEYLELRPQIRDKLSTKKDLEFLKQIDKWFKVRGEK